MWSTREDKARATFDEESLAHFLSMNPTFGRPQVSRNVVREANRIRRQDAKEYEEDQKWQRHVHTCMEERSKPIMAPDPDTCAR